MTLAQIGVLPEDSVMTSSIQPGYVFPYLKNPRTIRLSLSERPYPRGSRRISRLRYPVVDRKTLSSSPDDRAPELPASGQILTQLIPEARPPDFLTYRPPDLPQLIPRGQTSRSPDLQTSRPTDLQIFLSSSPRPDLQISRPPDLSTSRPYGVTW
ncbi:glycine dehydrogenase (decarboxylating), mitochondrial-like [Dorcoceras hygrometricum]|uniref:Glycine dehydrogenase (Decarboxylating), mitochondrial-like n=1 Tax=Dorcoceras hygrometricum TaxID=472368 RepID=A0A2Z7BSA6_9LAMI|nr:glycine dehydrogenase (decarboxylating), mitochondrial-like [Dorcoceras hygrometricum]